MSVDDAATALNTVWDMDATTVAGMVTAALGHLPIAGETVVIADYALEVERVAGKVLEAVLATRVELPEIES